MKIKILKYEDLTIADKEAIIKLMDVFRKPKGKKSITEKNVERAVKQENNTIVVAYDNDKIVGMATLYYINSFTAKLGIIDEVVVDKVYRGRGIASKIMEEIIKIAKKKKMDLLKVDTNISNPVNGLYKKFKFIKRDDNLYKLFL